MNKAKESFYFNFDFVLNKVSISDRPIPEEFKPLADIKSAGRCPYPIPKVEDIVSDLTSGIFKANTSKVISDVFECGAIAISNQVDFTRYEKREQRYLEIIKCYEPEEQALIATAFSKIYALLSSVVYDNGKFNDWLGSIFMQCNVGDGKTKQIFTPYSVSRVTAELQFTESEILKYKTGDEIMTIYEPCCGGGGMIMAAMDVLQNKYGINYARNCFVVCEDIDIRCIHMTYLQLSLAGVPAIIKHQNAITRELWDVWETPAYIFQYLRFRKFTKNI